MQAMLGSSRHHLWKLCPKLTTSNRSRPIASLRHLRCALHAYTLAGKHLFRSRAARSTICRNVYSKSLSWRQCFADIKSAIRLLSPCYVLCVITADPTVSCSHPPVKMAHLPSSHTKLTVERPQSCHLMSLPRSWGTVTPKSYKPHMESVVIGVKQPG